MAEEPNNKNVREHWRHNGILAPALALAFVFLCAGKSFPQDAVGQECIR